MLNSSFVSEIECDKLKEECGVFGVYNVRNASYECFLGLNNLQHRGQEACGIVSFDNKSSTLHEVLGMGEVSEVFIRNRIGSQEGVHFADSLPGRFAIGHVRYSTSGKKNDTNIQPISGRLVDGEDKGKNIVIAHNGNLIRLDDIRLELSDKGCTFKTTMDTEVILHLIIESKQFKTIDKIREALRRVSGAYSLVIMIDETLIGIRDPFGVRPLVLGQIKKDNSYFLSSESCALDIAGAEHVCDIKHGGVVVIKNDSYTIFDLFEERQPQKFCLFEYIYLSRPDSVHDGNSVYEVRKRMGMRLAEECPVIADIVIPVPDSGTPAALGYSEYAKIPFGLGIIRNQYIGRTFLKPSDEKRNSDLHIKHNANRAVVEGKRVIVIDDSMVRGNTSKKIVKMLRDSGASEVHLRIACPEIKFSCLYGIDTPDRNELISNNKGNLENICEFLGLDSLGFLTTEGMYSAISSKETGKKIWEKKEQFCDACFTGNYFI